uniref:Uncharacterized protein n=1 Tax=Rhizophora mucronata TaxID=61149 RepID=A0A2P2N1V2_RHIMU
MVHSYSFWERCLYGAFIFLWEQCFVIDNFKLATAFGFVKRKCGKKE